MIEGRLTGRRVLIDKESDASTLRNRGFTGTNRGQKLSLDLMTSLYLVSRKRVEIRMGKNSLDFQQIREMMTPDERKIASAYQFLKDKGMKPSVKKREISISGSRVLVFRDGDEIELSTISPRSNFVCITDSEEDSLLYSIRELPLRSKRKTSITVGKDSRDTDLLIESTENAGMRVASGLKYGCKFRVYEGASTHAKYLMEVSNLVSAKDIIARVRISQSVRKTFVQAFFDKAKNKFRLLEIRWVRL